MRTCSCVFKIMVVIALAMGFITKSFADEPETHLKEQMVWAEVHQLVEQNFRWRYQRALDANLQRCQLPFSIEASCIQKIVFGANPKRLEVFVNGDQVLFSGLVLVEEKKKQDGIIAFEVANKTNVWNAFYDISLDILLEASPDQVNVSPEGIRSYLQERYGPFLSKQRLIKLQELFTGDCQD